MKTLVEAQLQDDRLPNAPKAAHKDYNIKYQDGDQEMINVSDDEDLLTAYEVAQKELQGNLKFVVEIKPPKGEAQKEEMKVPEQKVSEGEPRKVKKDKKHKVDKKHKGHKHMKDPEVPPPKMVDDFKKLIKQEIEQESKDTFELLTHQYLSAPVEE